MLVCRVLFALLFWGACGIAQTTQAMILGRVRDQITNAPLGDVTIEYEQLETNTHGTSYSAPDGNFYLPLLPPGSYRVRASLKGFQAKEMYGLRLTVGGYASIDFKLRPLSDVWERGRYRTELFKNDTILPFYGPDVDASYVGTFEPERFDPGQLEPSISDVIDPRAIALLPLAGRDIYTTLALLPGVTTDSSTNRSLGLSANGQRPTSSNFLLDGLEENDELLSGPAVQLAPEMIQEYRISTNNFSAEYGRTLGYLANAITRSAARRWHGIGYGDLGNDRLNANTFQHNANGVASTTLHQIEGAFSAGGSIPKSRLLTWTAFDYFGSRSYADATSYELPTQAFAQSLPHNLAGALLRDYPPVEWAAPSRENYGPVSLAAPVTLRRKSMLERVDYLFSGRQHLMVRGVGDFLHRPDFNWSAYGEAPLSERHLGVAAGLTSAWSPSVVSELRGSVRADSRRWDLALGTLPQINGIGYNIELPGNCCGLTGKIDQGWRETMHASELGGNLVISRGAHVLKLGGGDLAIRLRTRFETPEILSFWFASQEDFAADNPYQVDLLLSRVSHDQGLNEPLNTDRFYRYEQQYAFIQEDWRISRRLTLNAGLRYDRFPSPVNVGSAPDVLVQPPPGTTLEDQNAGFSFVRHTGALFTVRPNNVAVRLGFSLLLSASGTVLRGGFGTFQDRPPENFWISASANELTERAFRDPPCALAAYFSGDYQHPILGSSCSQAVGNRGRYDLTAFKPNLTAPLVQSVFVSLQQPLGRRVALELSGLGSRGRRLLTTDIVNRAQANDSPVIDYRTNQGFSDYAAASARVRYRTGRATLSSAWTWSHSIDNQSDPLLGEYFDLGFSNQTDRSNPRYHGTFTLPGNTRIDRGNSDFDQRLDFIGWGTFELPSPRNARFASPLRDWAVASVFSVRSGLPYSVFAGTNDCSPVCNARANLVNPSIIYQRIPISGGVRILNPAAFESPSEGQEGNTGRNVFQGPGFSNIDVSLSRSFAVPPLGEQARLIFRADVFNVLNHANLQSPHASLGCAVQPHVCFGDALYGRIATNSGFPALTPVVENAREVHLLLRLEF